MPLKVTQREKLWRNSNSVPVPEFEKVWRKSVEKLQIP